MKKTMLAIGMAVVLPAATDAYAHRGEAGSQAGAYTLEVTDPSGMTLPTYAQGGRTYVLGLKGERYQIRVRNRSGQRVEAVISVDGRDVVDGGTANWRRRGYVIDPYGDVLVDGFRLDLGSVAAFRFSDVKDSYASKMGSARQVGVIGVAIFPQRVVSRPRLADRENRRWGGYGARDESPSAGESTRSAESAAAPAAPSADGGALGQSGRGGVLAPSERPGLGTEFGEQRHSPVTNVAFHRARPNHPDHVLTVRYNDRRGLQALGIRLDPLYASDEDAQLREDARPFEELSRGFSRPPSDWRP